MNEVALNGNGGAVSVNQGNFFEAYGEQASQKTIVGSLLKFSKGDYSAGSNNADIPVGTELVANMDELLVGWIRWHGGKPTDQLMGPVVKGFQAAKRNTLGDDDESIWEVDNNGKSQDPWAFSNYLVLKDRDVEGDAGLFTFTTSSRGGLNAIGDLCKVYGKSMRARPNDYPIIALNVDSYIHTSFGKIKVPQFDVVGWAPKAIFGAAGDSGDENDKAEQAKVNYAHPADSSGRAPRGSASPAAATKF